MDHPLNRQLNAFSVEIQKKEHNLVPKIDQVITTKLKQNSVSADHLKSQLGYDEEDAEIWVFVAGDASTSI